MTLRRAVVAGTFYPAAAAGLLEAIRASYMHRLGPGRLPAEGGGNERAGVKACVCPHAGYAYSGPVAAHSFLEASKLAAPMLAVIVGPNHYGVGSGVATYGEGEWETPLGAVRVDGATTRRIVELTGTVGVDPAAHAAEHSIEVQLPFLQAVFGASFSFVPVSLSFQDKGTARQLARGLAEVLREVSGRSVLLLASSDLTHYEPAPQAREKDTALLKHVQALDVDGFYATLERRRVTACGYGAIATVMEACRLLGYGKGRVNAYSTSGDVTGENDEVVGYPSVTFER